MPVTLTVGVLFSVSQYSFARAQINGLGADLRNIYLVQGVDNAGPPATFGDLAGGGYDSPLDQQQLQVSRQAGASVLAWTDSWSAPGALGDQVWFGVVVSPAAPIGADALVAVAGPFLIGP